MALSWTSGRLENFRMTSAGNESIRPTPAGSGTPLRASASGGTVSGHHLTGPRDGAGRGALTIPTFQARHPVQGRTPVCGEPPLGRCCSCSPRSGSRWRRA